MRVLCVIGLALVVASLATPVKDSATSPVELGESDGKEESVASLQKKLSGLQKTFERIKGSCTADNVNSEELGEIIDEHKTELGESVEEPTVEELKAKIKKENAAIDKIADKCMPGEEEEEELGESNEAVSVSSLEKKLKGLQKTFDRIKSSCTADNVNSRELGEIIQQNIDVELGESASPKATSIKKLKAEVKKKNAAIDKIADACMPGEEVEYADEE